jgi:hypothetical protein
MSCGNTSFQPITGWWVGTFFIFHIFGIETSTGFHIFQRGSFTTNQISWRIRIHKNYQTTPHKKSTKMVSSEVLKSSQSGPPKAPKIMDIDRKKHKDPTMWGPQTL